MDWQPQTLAQLAQISGFTMADVAFLAGLEESTISRLWDNVDWLDRVKGRSLQCLVGILPGVAEYVYHHSIRSRQSRLIEKLNHEGLEVDENTLRHLVTEERVPEQYLGNALEAAIFIMRNDTRMSAAHLMRFWGRMQDFALGYLFEHRDNRGILKNPARLVDASIKVVRDFENRTNSFHTLIAQANLTHYIARAPDGQAPTQLPSERQAALSYRSGMIGRIIERNDFEVAEKYIKVVRTNNLLTLMEDWAFPTYTHDMRATSDFSVPRSILLKQTAEEVLREVHEYNDAYIYYLTKVYLPIALRRDPTFGLRVTDLKLALIQRVGTCVSDNARRACELLIQQLERK